MKSKSKKNADLIRVRAEESIAWIEMRDEAGHNGFSEPFVGALLAAFEEVSADTRYRVAILAGLEGIFSSGATRQTLEELQGGKLATNELVLGRVLMNMPIPVVAAAEGHAIGGGLALLLSTDIRIIAQDSRYGANFMTLGITPGMGTTCLLETVLGSAQAHELLYTGELRRGRDFSDAAFNAVLPASEVRTRAFDVAWRIAEHPRRNSVLLKRALTMPRKRRLEEAMMIESLMHEVSLSSLDFQSLEGAR